MIWGKADKKYIRRKTFLLFVPRFHLQLLTRASDIRNRNVIYRVKFKSTVITFPFVFFIRWDKTFTPILAEKNQENCPPKLLPYTKLLSPCRLGSWWQWIIMAILAKNKTWTFVLNHTSQWEEPLFVFSLWCVNPSLKCLAVVFFVIKQIVSLPSGWD